MALTADRRIAVSEGNSPPPLPLAAGVRVHAGGLVSVRTTGYACPLCVLTTSITAGFAAEAVDNTAGADGAATVRIVRNVAVWLKNDTTNPVTVAHLHRQAGAVDDETVRSPSGGVAAVGKILALDSVKGVLVEIK